jgi:hypothetical protein
MRHTYYDSLNREGICNMASLIVMILRLCQRSTEPHSTCESLNNTQIDLKLTSYDTCDRRCRFCPTPNATDTLQTCC